MHKGNRHWPPNKTLGLWVMNQRLGRGRPEHIQKLDELGFEWRSQNQMLKVDSADKLYLVKNEHLKTPPKGEGHSIKIAYRAFWEEDFCVKFTRSPVFFKNGGFISGIES